MYAASYDLYVDLLLLQNSLPMKRHALFPFLTLLAGMVKHVGMLPNATFLLLFYHHLWPSTVLSIEGGRSTLSM